MKLILTISASGPKNSIPNGIARLPSMVETDSTKFFVL
jgi:hypothetical protein